MVFFRKYLADAVREDPASIPMIAPQMLTMNEFFFKVSGAEPAGRVSLLLELYECYRKLNRNAEPLDDFIFWGDVILPTSDSFRIHSLILLIHRGLQLNTSFPISVTATA